MIAREAFSRQGPHRLLGGLLADEVRPGLLGVIVAGVGEGKTACLVELGLDHLVAGRRVLHVALGQAVAHVQSIYDAQLGTRALIDLGPKLELERAGIGARRMISAFTNTDLVPDRLTVTLERLEQHLDFSPDVILADSLDWAGCSDGGAERILAIRAACRPAGAQLWITASIWPPGPGCEELVDIALLLEPQAGGVGVRVLATNPRAHGSAETTLAGLPDAPSSGRAPSACGADYTLLSGGAAGAEAAFGGCAERWGLTELHFTYEGRTPRRTRGLVVLTKEELAQGAVSQRYLQARMRRDYPNTVDFEKTLQTIWHQVNTAGEIFVVGQIQGDGTVRGGTGWAAELGRLQRKTVHVFDQRQDTWLSWSAEREAWLREESPRITSRRFCGTGTRQLSEAGRAAIEALFVRSFEAPAPE